MSELDMSKILDLNAAQAIRDWVKDNFVTKNELVTLGLVSQLYVTFDEDFVSQTYTITGADKTYSGVVPESKEVLLLVNTPNTTYTVACSDVKGVEYTCKIAVGSKTGRYAGELEGFYAYLHVQAESGATVTATLDDKSYTGMAGEDGYCILKVKDSGTYSVVASIGESVCEAIEAVVGETAGETIEVVCGEIPLEMVGWSDGTDVQIARMIDAARAGKIDLQADGGWKVGDERVVETTFNKVTCVLVISSFEDYNDCGNLMQFDFKNPITSSKINMEYSSNTSYRNTKIHTTLIPELIECLPMWLSNRLVEFTINDISNPMNDKNITTVEGNKLALRSKGEIFGGSSDEKQVEYYKTEVNRRKTYYKKYDRVNWWTRTPYDNGRKYYYVSFSVSADLETGEIGNSSSSSIGKSCAIAPFGCL